MNDAARPPAPRPANKNIIVCSDGTGNTVNKGRGTNVFKLFEAVDRGGHLDDPTLTRQVAIYDDGVGSEGFRIVRAISGGIGLGLARNVRHLYRELARVYEPGDRIYMFGFSRGAFTVRTLAGLINICGIIDRRSTHRPALLPFLTPGSNVWMRWVSWRAWRAHRWKYRALLETVLFSAYPRDSDAVVENYRKAYSLGGADKSQIPRIHFVGVWDTVGAVAVPSNGLRVFLNNFVYRFSFPNKTLPEICEKGCHALAIDEERHAFWPVLWDEPFLLNDGTNEEAENVVDPNTEDVVPAPVGVCACGFVAPEGQQEDSLCRPEKRSAEPRVEQVWFSGVHTNVGGGYPKQGVSHVALDWMMAMAERHGLRFGSVREDLRRQRDIHDRVYDSRRGGARYYVYWPRELGELVRKGIPEPKFENAPGGKVLGWPAWKVAQLRYLQRTNAVLRVHASTFDRIAAHTEGYAPSPISDSLEVVGTPGERRSDLEQLRSRVAGRPATPAKNLVRVRWAAQAALYAYTLFAIWYAGFREESQELRDDVWESYGDGTFAMLEAAWGADQTFVIVTVAALSILYAVSWTARARLRALQSSHWRGVFDRNAPCG